MSIKTDPEATRRMKALEVGQLIKVECDHKWFGRIASRGTIVDLRGPKARLALVNVDGPVQGCFHANILIPKRDIHWLELFD